MNDILKQPRSQVDLEDSRRDSMAVNDLSKVRYGVGSSFEAQRKSVDSLSIKSNLQFGGFLKKAS